MTSILFDYERVDGNIVHPRLRDLTNVPVPHVQVREWAGVPEKYQYACLSRDLPVEFYPPTVRETLVRYVKEYQHVAYYGSTLVLAGKYDNMGARQWAASAVINEITMRFHEHADVTSRWTSERSVAAITEIKGDAYHAMRARTFDTKLLLVLDPQQCGLGTPQAKFIEHLLAHRWDRKLPTIVTLTMRDPDAESVWEDLHPLLGQYTSEMLRDTCHDYFVRY